jgi:hypothetical protein
MHFYGASDELLTDTFDKAIDNEPPGPVFIEEEWPQENHFRVFASTEVAELRRILSAREPALRRDVIQLDSEHTHRILNPTNVAAPSAGAALSAGSLQTEVKLSQAVCRNMSQRAELVEAAGQETVNVNSTSREQVSVNSPDRENWSDNEWMGNASDKEWMDEAEREPYETGNGCYEATESECAEAANECAEAARAERAQRRSEWLKQDKYAKFHPTFQNLIKIVDGDLDAYEEMVKEFQGLEFRLAAIASNNKKGGDSSSKEPQKGIVSSSLELERSRRSKQKKPIGSP